METAPCSCVMPETAPECCVCMNKICAGGSMHPDICPDCVMRLSPDESGRILHPARRTPLRMCKCGKPWNMQCSMASLMKTTVFDTTKLTNDPTVNMQLIRDPANFMSDPGHGLVIE